MSTEKIITDRDIQLARERARDYGHAVDVALVEMLQQLLDYRRASREVVTKHDYRAHYNKAMSHLDTLVDKSGCQWWACDQEAATRRVRNEAHSRGEATCLCCKHADEGEQKGLWINDDPMNVEWCRRDHETRKWAQKRAEERAQEGVTP